MERNEDKGQNGKAKVIPVLKPRFERMYLDSKAKTEPVQDHNQEQGLNSQPLSEFEKNLETKKQLMLKEINYDLKKLNETEGKLRAVSEIMTVFSHKVIEQGMVTEQSRQN